MSKKDDPNIIKHELLRAVKILRKQTEIIPLDKLVKHICQNKNISAEYSVVKIILAQLHRDQLIAIDIVKKDEEEWFIKDLTSIGEKALIDQTFIKEYKKEKRNRLNETGQILSPYISIAALIITAVLFIVDKCSQPKSYEVIMGGKQYVLKEKN